jgi:hypothetical protein
MLRNVEAVVILFLCLELAEQGAIGVALSGFKRKTVSSWNWRAGGSNTVAVSGSHSDPREYCYENTCVQFTLSVYSAGKTFHNQTCGKR